MVRNTYPQYMADATLQRQNMNLDLGLAMSRLDDASREKFDGRVEEQIFPFKIWLICETNLLSRYLTWFEEEGMIMINLDEFEGGLLANRDTSSLFKTGKLVSFIRQFNLYDFKKRHDVFVDVDGNGRQVRFGLYSHEYVRQGRADLLKHCKRKVVKRIHLTGCGGIKHKSYESDFEETSEEPVAIPVPSKKLRPQLTPPIKQEPVSSLPAPEVKPLPSFKLSFIDTGIALLNTSISTAVAQYHPPPPPLVATVTPPLPNVQRVQTRSSAVTKESAETKLRKETNKTLLMQRWMELPEEWQVLDMSETPEQNDDWLRQYNWNLDPMVVGELAALAGTGSELSLDFLDYCFPNGKPDLESLLLSSLDSLPSTSSDVSK